MTETNPLMANPVVRQLGVMIGIAASVALGVAVVLWSQTPNYSVLFANLASKDVSSVIDALQKSNVSFKVDPATGAVMVPSADVQMARLKLAGEGLPQSNGFGFELLQQDTGFGTSRLVEEARYQRAIEGELSRTIASLANIETARVHLAIPKRSVFVRQRKHPSASVVVKLFSGRTLEKGQVEAIVHLVASSIPELDPSRVTLVDHKGRLMKSQSDSSLMNLTNTQFEYTSNLEKHFKARIEGLLGPLLGFENIRAEVTADVDFTVTEQTQERYNPDQGALRSEQVNEQSSRLGATQGVPGALSNQPPAAGRVPEELGGNSGQSTNEPLNTSKHMTRNYEVDKTLSHTQLDSGVLRRLSVAVVVNDHMVADEDGNITRTSRTQEEISRINSLVKEAIGYTLQRGDSVKIINAPFHQMAAPEPLPELEIWQEPWFWDVVRQVGGVVLVLLLIFGVLKPTMKKLSTPVVVARQENEMVSAEGVMMGENGMPAQGAASEMLLPGASNYETTLEAARGMINEDPKRVAQVVKKWVAEDAG
ncbi:MAG: flagellar M-ring protein FliF [Candidatus Polarisedimenticolaceae bacterium]|nr:flagellar M-ring protein FliF [Candidatus Polarisedimenticolaceae bacterium]